MCGGAHQESVIWSPGFWPKLVDLMYIFVGVELQVRSVIRRYFSSS